MLGIALGITVLITVLSVMNGFDYQIKSRIFGMARQVSVTGITGEVSNWQSLEKTLSTVPGVVDVAPFVDGQGMLSNGGSVRPVMITGIYPKQESAISSLSSHMTAGSFDQLKAGRYGVVIGDILAASLGVGVGDKLIIITPQATVTPVGIMPRFKRFNVVGTFHIGGNLGLNRGVAFINLRDAQTLFNLHNAVSGIRVKVNNLYAAPTVSNRIAGKVSSQYVITNWTQEYGAFFKAIQMEKTMMFIILLLIIAVAAFNLVSTLVMVVTDKRAEIAILKTLGASPRAILSIFMVQGGIIGIFGTLLGLIGGVALALNVTSVVNWIQNTFRVHFISSSVYFIDYLPSKLESVDVVHVCLWALILSLLATIYPAWQASRTQPAEALRYE